LGSCSIVGTDKNAEGAPGSGLWNLGLGFSFTRHPSLPLTGCPILCAPFAQRVGPYDPTPQTLASSLSSISKVRSIQLPKTQKQNRCHPEERLSAKRPARRRTRRRISTYPSCLHFVTPNAGCPTCRFCMWDLGLQPLATNHSSLRLRFSSAASHHAFRQGCAPPQPTIVLAWRLLFRLLSVRTFASFLTTGQVRLRLNRMKTGENPIQFWLRISKRTLV
jgi:hypothetical protein